MATAEQKQEFKNVLDALAEAEKRAETLPQFAQRRERVLHHAQAERVDDAVEGGVRERETGSVGEHEREGD